MQSALCGALAALGTPGEAPLLRYPLAKASSSAKDTRSAALMTVSFWTHRRLLKRAGEGLCTLFFPYKRIF